MTREEELIELLDKETIADDAIFCEHPLSHSMQEQRNAIEKTFREFGLQGKITSVYSAPQVNCFDFVPGVGEKLFKYETIRAKIKMALTEFSDVRMLLPVPGTNTCRLEMPKAQRSLVAAGDLFRSQEWRDSQAMLPLALGKGLDGSSVIIDLTKAPHLLIAGTTGAGKSVLLDSCIHSLMLRHTPDELKFIFADPKIVEFDKYNDLPYLQFPVISEPEDLPSVLEWLNVEMDRRYKMLAETSCRNISALNEQKPGSLPYIVVIINELADFMLVARSQLEMSLSRICVKSRAVGIHVIISTTRPDSQVLTGDIKANLPTRIAFKVACQINSRTILGVDDAVELLGLGDMLFRGPGAEALTRIQGIYVNEQESARILERLKSMYSDMKPNALPHLRVMWRNRNDALRKQLFAIVFNVLEDELDWLKDDIIDDTSNALTDALIENWDELQCLEENWYELQWLEDSYKTNAEANDDSNLLLKAIKIVIESRRPTISHIQRMLGIGYNKACDIMEELEEYGIISPQKDSAMRSVLVNTYKEALSRLPKQNYGHD